MSTKPSAGKRKRVGADSNNKKLLRQSGPQQSGGGSSALGGRGVVPLLGAGDRVVDQESSDEEMEDWQSSEEEGEILELVNGGHEPIHIINERLERLERPRSNVSRRYTDSQQVAPLNTSQGASFSTGQHTAPHTHAHGTRLAARAPAPHSAQRAPPVPPVSSQRRSPRLPPPSPEEPVYSFGIRHRGIVSTQPAVQRSDPQEFSCPICWELLYRPVSLECGHTSCELCIAKWVNQTLTNGTSTAVCPAGCQRILPLMVPEVNTVLSGLISRQFPAESGRRQLEDTPHVDLVNRMRIRTRRRNSTNAGAAGGPRAFAIMLGGRHGEQVVNPPQMAHMLQVQLQVPILQRVAVNSYKWLGVIIFILLLCVRAYTPVASYFNAEDVTCVDDTSKQLSKTGVISRAIEKLKVGSTTSEAPFASTPTSTKSSIFGMDMTFAEFLKENMFDGLRSVYPLNEPRTAVLYLLIKNPVLKGAHSELDMQPVRMFDALYAPLMNILPDKIPVFVKRFLIVIAVDVCPLVVLTPQFSLKMHTTTSENCETQAGGWPYAEINSIELLIASFIPLLALTIEVWIGYYRFWTQVPRRSFTEAAKNLGINVAYELLWVVLICIPSQLIFTYIFSWELRLSFAFICIIFELFVMRFLAIGCTIFAVLPPALRRHQVVQQMEGCCSCALMHWIGPRLFDTIFPAQAQPADFGVAEQIEAHIHIE